MGEIAENRAPRVDGEGAVVEEVCGAFHQLQTVEEAVTGLLTFKVRDKDAPASICLICEIAAWAKDQGKTLYDLLMQISQEVSESMPAHTASTFQHSSTSL